MTLDIVQRALPHNDFVVVFGDTGMEFPDTYAMVEDAKIKCAQMGISFYVAKSHMKPADSWRMFGPPHQQSVGVVVCIRPHLNCC